MQCAEAQHAAECSITAPGTCRCEGDDTGYVILIVVDEQTQRTVNELQEAWSIGAMSASRLVAHLLNQLCQAMFSPNDSFRAANDIVAVRQEPSIVGWRVRLNIENVPDVFCGRQRGPLEDNTKRGGFSWDWEEELADLLALNYSIQFPSIVHTLDLVLPWRCIPQD